MDVRRPVVVVAVEAHHRQVADPVLGPGRPHHLFGPVVGHLEHHQVRQLQGEPLGITEAGVQLKLQGKSRPAVRRLPIEQVHLVEPTWVCRLACELRATLEDHRGQAVVVPAGLVGVPGRPDAHLVRPLGQLVVDGLLGLRGPEEHDLAAGLEDGVELTDSRQQLFPHADGPGSGGGLDVVREDQVGPGPRQLPKDPHRFDRWALIRDCGPDVEPVHG